MAQEIKDLKYLTLDKTFDRANGQPLDGTILWNSLEEAKEYIKTPKAYIGQTIAVVENNKAVFYIIQPKDDTHPEPYLAKIDADIEKYIHHGQDNESLIIGNDDTNVAGTKGFIIEKAVREIQEDGSYKYYYYLKGDNSNIKKQSLYPAASGFDSYPFIEKYGETCDIQPGDEITVSDDIMTITLYSQGKEIDIDGTGTKFTPCVFSARFETPIQLTEKDLEKVKAVSFIGINELIFHFESSRLTNQFEEILSKKSNLTYSLRTYYLNKNNNNKLLREYADDYGQVYSAEYIDINGFKFIKVEVERVKKTADPVPNSGVDKYGYGWDSNNEIDYKDTYTYTDDTASDPTTPAYSYFRLVDAPELGTHDMPTHSLVAGGSNNKALGKDSFVTGSDNIANGAHSVVFGDENYVNYAGIASGRKNKVLNKSGVAFGERNIVRGYGSVAMGSSNEIGEHSYSAAIGQYLKTHNAGEAVVGGYNIPLDKLDKKDDGTIKTVALSVGAGWSEATRRDAITVYKDGTTKVLGDVYSGSTNVTQTAKNAKSGADSATAAANEAKKIANQANTDITSLENAVEIMNDRLTADVDELYELSKNIKDDRTTLQLGELPEKGVVDKLYITDDSEQYIYKIRKTPKVENVWDGIIPKSNPFPTDGSKGKGTIDDPYQITNGNELAYVVSGKMGINYFYYKLMNDIYLNDLNCIDWETGQIKIANYTPKPWINTAHAKVEWNGGFCGEFDGNNHSVYGLYFVDSTGLDHTNGTALFPRMIEDNSSHKGNPTAVIKNLEIDYFHINTLSWSSSLIGYEQWAHYEVSNCAIGKNVHLKGNRVSDIGSYGNAKLKITNTYSLSNKIYTERCAFAAAHHWSSTAEAIKMDNCYNLNGPLFISSASRNINNCYHTDESSTIGTVIAKEDMMGINALDNMPGLNTYVEGGKKALGKNLLEYLGNTSSVGNFSCEQLEDGGINIGVWAGSPDEGDCSFEHKMFLITNYDASKQYKLSIKWVEEYNTVSNYVSFNITSNGEIYISGTMPAGMPPFYAIAYIQAEEGTVATEWEKPNIVEIEGGWVYTNDYTYPHLTSFVEGWKCIDKDIEIPECEVTQEELDELKAEIEKINVNTNIVNYLKYEIVDNEVAITGYQESITAKVTIPDFIDGYSVTSIRSSAFFACDSLTSVTIPDSVTSIGESAFWKCSSLTSVTIPDSITSIGRNTFYDCKSLKSVTIPDSVTSIGSSAFACCSSLKSVIIGSSVTSIGNYAFEECSSLTSVTIGSSVTSIGNYAFDECYSLTDVYYRGSQGDRNDISIGIYNKPLTDVTWHYNYSFDAIYNELNSLRALVDELIEQLKT